MRILDAQCTVRLNLTSDEDKNVNLKTLLGLLAVAVLFFFGIVFALASVYAASRLVVAGLLFAAGFAILYYVARRPRTVIQRLELSGEMKAVPIKCPNCSASIHSESIKIVSGVPYATCPYCGQTFQVVEEPKW